MTKEKAALEKLNNSLDDATRFVVKVFGKERWQGLTIPLLALVMALFSISLLMLALGHNPFEVFRSFLAGAGWIPKPRYGGGQSQLTDLINLATTFTPMLFGALGFIVAFRAGLFNIGIAGQMVLSGFIATVFVGYSDLPAVVAVPLVFLIAIVVGALAGGLIGFLKHQFNIHEVVSSIMLNNIFILTVSYFIKVYYLDPVSRNALPASSYARLLTEPVQMGEASARLPIGFLVAILAAVALWFFLTKTRQGFEMTAVGKSPKAANYAGIKIGRTTVFAMMISGALGGLAGVTHYLASVSSMAPNQLPGVGFDAIAVALLGSVHPLGAILATALITTFTSTATYMSSIVGVRQEIAAVIVGMVLLFTACGGYLRMWVEGKKHSFADTSSTSELTGTSKGGDE
jgi:simple sugar transport system permease protein